MAQYEDGFADGYKDALEIIRDIYEGSFGIDEFWRDIGDFLAKEGII